MTDRSAKARSARQKGAKFERLVRRMVNESWGVRLERTPGSGSWGKMRTKGDLVSDLEKDPNFPFFIEVKKQEAWNLDQVVLRVGLVEKWWVKARGQAKEEAKIPLLVFSRNRRPIYVRVPRLVLTRRWNCAPRVDFGGSSGSVVCLFDDLLEAVRRRGGFGKWVI